MMKTQSFILYLLLLGLPSHSYADEHSVSPLDNGDNSIISIGLVVDMESWVGRFIHSCIRMALSDFYDLNKGYAMGIALHVRDCRGDSFTCIDAGEFCLLQHVLFLLFVLLIVC